jgi:hypothetical protein
MKRNNSKQTKGKLPMKNTIKNTTTMMLLAAALAALLLASNAYASGPFSTSYSNASLTGVYGYSIFGWILGPSNNGGKDPLDVAGVMWFDGNGTVKFHDTFDQNGSVAQRGTADNPIVGTYTVNPDGTGTMQFFAGSENHVRVFVIVDGGKELQFGNADSFSVNRGVAKKQ